MSSKVDDIEVRFGESRMAVAGLLWGGLEGLMREAALFAATGFLALGASDLVVDLLWAVVRLTTRRAAGGPPSAEEARRRLALFVPAWDEAAVLGAMLRTTLAAYEATDFRLYVGCYPNDPATPAAAAALGDPRVRIVVGRREGPTTKADCLNTLWRALADDEARGSWRAEAIVLHDAEDVVHCGEPALFLRHLADADLVQLPVLPLLDPGSRFVAGHYADEFAEAHGKELVVRQWLGAGLPSAGVGCAFSRSSLDSLAAAGSGLPFDAASLTEDYELGLRIAEAGGRALFLRVRHGDGSLVATREYFPATLAASVRQKSRWMAGIALCGWDRLGWRGGVAEHWMRLRDRQGMLAALLLFSGYVAMGLWLALKAREGLGGAAPAPLPPALSLLVRINLMLLLWRLAVRSAFTAAAYGPAEGLRAAPRAVVGNAVAMLAAAAALARYRRLRRTGRTAWDKTQHRYPAETAAA
jgi:adsorption protein B